MTTYRTLTTALREVLRLFWHAPDDVLAATFHHYFGNPDAARRHFTKAKERADGEVKDAP